jgi:hypothetical protein
MKIKFSFPYDWPIFRQTPNNSGIWEDHQFYLEDTESEYDAWVIFNFLKYPKEYINCPSDRIILITPEPYSVQYYPKSYINQFSTIITNQRELIHKNSIIYHTGQPWFVNKSYDELSNLKGTMIKKTKVLSIISSNKLITDGHKKRFDFALKLKDYFKEDIDLFGRGINNFDDKWEVIEPYKYNICLENCSQNDYFTEKINDCFLAYTFPIYYGCKNLSDYYDSDSFANIDINNYNQSLKKIDNILNDSKHYDEHLNSLNNSRNKYLSNFNLFPLIVEFLNKIGKSEMDPNINKLQNSFYDLRTISEKIVYKINNK